MKKTIIQVLSLFIIFIYGCKNRTDKVTIWIENNSEISNNIEFTTFLGDSIVDKRTVKKDSIADRILSFEIKLLKLKRLVFKFKTLGGNETTCLLKPDSITNKTLLHVNYVEKVLKKGKLFNGAVLLNDTLVRKDFYCEVMY